MAMAAGIVMMAVGAGSGAYGEYRTGVQKRDLHYENAVTNEMKADDAIWRGGIQVQKLRASTNKLIGNQRVAFAAAGVDVKDSDSTAMNVFNDTVMLSENDVMTIKANAAREAWGYRRAAQSERKQGDIDYDTGVNRGIATIFGGVGKGLSMSG